MRTDDLLEFIDWLNIQTEFIIDPASTVDADEILAAFYASRDEKQPAESHGQPDVMDIPGYWEFVEATPPDDEYGYEVIDGDERWFTAAVNAPNAQEAEMRAVQVAKHRGKPESVSGGATFLNEVRGKRWAVDIEAW